MINQYTFDFCDGWLKINKRMNITMYYEKENHKVNKYTILQITIHTHCRMSIMPNAH